MLLRPVFPLGEKIAEVAGVGSLPPHEKLEGTRFGDFLSQVQLSLVEPNVVALVKEFPLRGGFLKENRGLWVCFRMAVSLLPLPELEGLFSILTLTTGGKLWKCGGPNPCPSDRASLEILTLQFLHRKPPGIHQSQCDVCSPDAASCRGQFSSRL